MMLMPGLGERSIPVRIRLTTALLITLVFFPLVQASYPQNYTDNANQPFLMLFSELAVGLVLGITGRIIMSSLQTAGTVIAQLMGLGFVTSVDPSQGQQGALLSTFFTVTAVALVLALDLHHLIIGAIGMSYDIFRPGLVPDMGDSANYVVRLSAAALTIGIQMSIPFIVFALIFNIGMGLLARMMPQMQVFFVGLPASMGLSFIILGLVFSAMMMVFIQFLQGNLSNLVIR